MQIRHRFSSGASASFDCLDIKASERAALVWIGRYIPLFAQRYNSGGRYELVNLYSTASASRQPRQINKLPGSHMHFWQSKGRSLARSATATISKGAQLALLLCGLLGIGSVLLVSSGTMASPNATGSNPDVPSVGQARRKAPPAMVWIPGGTFLMGTK